MSEEAKNETTEPEGTSKATPAGTGDTEKPKGDMIPKARLDAEIAKRKATEGKLAEWEKEKQEAADEKAQAAGTVQEAQAERDKYKADSERWEAYATVELEAERVKLSEEDGKYLDSKEDLPLSERLSLAKHLASRTTEDKPKPAVGSKGGPAGNGGDAAVEIPRSVTTRGEYHDWLRDCGESEDPEIVAKIVNPKSMAKIREEAKQRQLI